MLQAEKRTFLYFLLTYILSSLILFFIGINFYYNLSRHNLLEKKAFELRSDIFEFIEKNRIRRFLKTNINPDFNGKKIVVLKNGNYLIGNNKLDSFKANRAYWIDNGVLFFNYEKQRRDDLLYFIAKKDISKELNSLKNKIIYISLAFISIIVLVAYILGKLFLMPISRAIKIQDEFISDATHELNTPISNILVNIELLRELYPNLRDIEEFEKIESSTKRVSKIFKNLSYLKLNQNYKKEIKSIDIAKVIDSRVEFFSTLIKSKGLVVDIKKGSLIIDIDYEDAIRLIDNLLSNAIKYSSKNSTIYIEISNRGFCIKNRGKIRDTKRVKRKFYRENQNEGGFGIGLFIVEKIALEYGFKFKISQDGDFVNSSILV